MKKFLLSALIAVATLTASAQSTNPQCSGTTKQNARCKLSAKQGSSFCRFHDPNTTRCGATTKAGAPCKMVVKTAGTKCHHHSK